ncbi:hypothetical protein CJG84_24395 [Salmonella enterica]|nr:hypothetical protein [Salmonella enterica]
MFQTKKEKNQMILTDLQQDILHCMRNEPPIIDVYTGKVVENQVVTIPRSAYLYQLYQCQKILYLMQQQ